MQLLRLLEILLLVAVVRAQDPAPEKEATPSEPKETLSDRDRRGTFYQGGPPFIDLPGRTFVRPATLSFHDIITGIEGIGPGDFPADVTISGAHQGGRCFGQRPCVPMVYCAPFYEEVVTQRQGCGIHHGGYGACCRQARRGSPAGFGGSNAPRIAAFSPESVAIDMPAISRQDVEVATSEGFATFQTLLSINTELQRIGAVLDDPQRPAYGHLQFFRTTPRAEQISNMALIQSFTGEALQRRLSLGPIQAGFGLTSIQTSDTPLAQTCPENPFCGKKEIFYRTSDGSCNNLHNPKYGQARTPLERILPPRYDDGMLTPRRSVTGRDLPSARLVSAANVPDVNRPSPDLTLAVMQWGQFIDHDLTHAPIFRFSNNSGIECCDEDGQLIDSSLLHPECFPIEIPPNDPFFSRLGRRCMNFVRSRPAPRNNCTIGFREQMNQITHFLDASAVYGSAEEEEREIRLGSGGLLKTQRNGLLPPDRFIDEADCFLQGTDMSCFLAGDSRVNEQPHLSVIHTLWVRQHNRIATELARLNPYWSDETLFQETKRIVVAQIQHIVYNEWLPLILGTETAERFGLLPRRDGFINEYDKFLNPAIRNEFAAVAFRFGHTLVEGMLNLFDKHHRQIGSIELFENFNRPRLVYQPKRLDQLLRTLIKQPMQSFDNFVIDDLTNRLFQTDETNFGMDLIALNTQRARDHGVPAYNDLREVCGLGRARNFHDLLDYLRPETVEVFKQLYASVDDIDPFVAGISERPVNGGVVGPLFNCIIRDQFSRLKFGDRFFYENGGMPTSFTEAQLFEIRKTSWAGIVCGNGEHIKKVQPLAFRLPGPNNEKVPCSSSTIPKLDLTPWISTRKSGRYHK